MVLSRSMTARRLFTSAAVAVVLMGPVTAMKRRLRRRLPRAQSPHSGHSRSLRSGTSRYRSNGRSRPLAQHPCPPAPEASRSARTKRSPPIRRRGRRGGISVRRGHDSSSRRRQRKIRKAPGKRWSKEKREAAEKLDSVRTVVYRTGRTYTVPLLAFDKVGSMYRADLRQDRCMMPLHLGSPSTPNQTYHDSDQFRCRKKANSFFTIPPWSPGYGVKDYKAQTRVFCASCWENAYQALKAQIAFWEDKPGMYKGIEGRKIADGDPNLLLMEIEVTEVDPTGIDIKFEKAEELD